MKKEIILSGNCFWCLEAIFQKIIGIEKVESGYYSLKNYDFKFIPDDKVEVVKVTYEEEKIDLPAILDIFYLSHTPVYNSWKKEDCFSYMHRSSIIVSDIDEGKVAEKKIKEIIDSKIFDGEVKTKVIRLIPGEFSLAKEGDRDYFNKNPKDGYSVSIIEPKLETIKSRFFEYCK